MADTAAQLGQDPQFDSFLNAPVGEDQRGISVSVLSMLARLGVDPWDEASDLATLPEGAARQRLEALIARFDDVQTLVPDRGRIVAGLLAFLPRRAAFAGISSGGTAARPALPLLNARFYWIIAAALIFGWVAMLAQGQ